MVEYPRLDLVFRALGDSTRRGMLRQLARREHTVGELAEPYRMSLASASKHVKALERADPTTESVKKNGRDRPIEPVVIESITIDEV